jgi:hypothetical protein
MGYKMSARSVKELVVYGKAYQFAMSVFELSKRFPKEEQFALTSQIQTVLTFAKGRTILTPDS